MTNSENKIQKDGSNKKTTQVRAQQLSSSRKKSNAEKKKTGLVERKFWIKSETAHMLAATKIELNGRIINGTEISEIGNILDLLVETYLSELIK